MSWCAVAKAPARKISAGITYRRNPERFIAVFRDNTVLYLDITNNRWEATGWRNRSEPVETRHPMRTFGPWDLSEENQRFVDAIMIAGAKRNAD